MSQEERSNVEVQQSGSMRNSDPAAPPDECVDPTQCPTEKNGILTSLDYSIAVHLQEGSLQKNVVLGGTVRKVA